MIKINYKNPELSETKEDVARHNLMIADKYKKGEYLEMSSISWLKIDSNRNYQDLEQLFRYLNLNAHVIACIVRTIPDNLKLSMPNKPIDSEELDNLEYVVKISCREKSDAMKELLLYHSSYEENFECLARTGCFVVKYNNTNEYHEPNKPNEPSNTKSVESEETINIKKVLNCELKLDFTFFKPHESINYIIEDLTTKYGRIPDKVICGEFNNKKVHALMLDKEIISPIGWINNNIEFENENNNETEPDYELVDFRTMKIQH